MKIILPANLFTLWTKTFSLGYIVGKNEAKIVTLTSGILPIHTIVAYISNFLLPLDLRNFYIVFTFILFWELSSMTLYFTLYGS